jgi:hypothetical protein
MKISVIADGPIDHFCFSFLFVLCWQCKFWINYLCFVLNETTKKECNKKKDIRNCICGLKVNISRWPIQYITKKTIPDKWFDNWIHISFLKQYYADMCSVFCIIRYFIQRSCDWLITQKKGLCVYTKYDARKKTTVHPFVVYCHMLNQATDDSSYCYLYKTN